MQKQILFLRHAIAIERGTLGVREEERPLSDKGRKRMIQATQGFAKINLAVDVLISSPLTRAFQTAEIIRDHLPFSGPIEIQEELGPGGNLNHFLQFVRKRPEEKIMIVGHEPDFSSWIEDLLGCERTGSIPMKKGGLCQLLVDFSFREPRAELLSLIPPRLARSLG